MEFVLDSLLLRLLPFILSAFVVVVVFVLHPSVFLRSPKISVRRRPSECSYTRDRRATFIGARPLFRRERRQIGGGDG